MQPIPDLRTVEQKSREAGQCGLKHAEIADELGLSQRTVNTHLNHTREKL